MQPEKSNEALLIFVLLTGLYNSIAFAGDAASRKILGFSPDGRYFAFEQYGVQDGSGFPYAEVFVIDTEEDKWVAEGPVRKRIDDEKATLAEARKAASAAARPQIETYDVSEDGERLASNPRAELSADPRKVVVNASHLAVPTTPGAGDLHPGGKDAAVSELQPIFATSRSRASS